MGKVAVLKFDKKGGFTSTIVDGDFKDAISKPGVYAIVGLTEVVKKEEPKKEEEEED